MQKAGCVGWRGLGLLGCTSEGHGADMYSENETQVCTWSIPVDFGQGWDVDMLQGCQEGRGMTVTYNGWI